MIRDCVNQYGANYQHEDRAAPNNEMSTFHSAPQANACGQTNKPFKGRIMKNRALASVFPAGGKLRPGTFEDNTSLGGSFTQKAQQCQKIRKASRLSRPQTIHLS
jgi:hypothetical protein